MLCYIIGILALFGMLVCVSVKEYECAFILSIVELTAFIVANFNQTERILKQLHLLNREMFEVTHDIVAVKNSIDFLSQLSNRNMIDITKSVDEIKQEINKTEKNDSTNL